jgi:hypothetical protein
MAIKLQPVTLTPSNDNVFVPSKFKPAIEVSEGEFLAMADYPYPLLVEDGNGQQETRTGYCKTHWYIVE